MFCILSINVDEKNVVSENELVFDFVAFGSATGAGGSAGEFEIGGCPVFALKPGIGAYDTFFRSFNR